MIQFNLLPDVKLEYIKAKNLKRSVIIVSMLIGGAALAIFILMFLTVNVFQKGHIGRLNKDIKEKSEKIEKTPDLNKVLTIQNQLKVLTGLHDKKPVNSRLFDFIAQIVPNKVFIGELEVDYAQSTVVFSGSTEGLDLTNKFVDTLKFTKFTYKDASNNDVNGSAFPSVVLTDFDRKEKDSTYKITATFDKQIFDVKNKITLEVPKDKTTTRSDVEVPRDFFKALPQEEKEQ